MQDYLSGKQTANTTLPPSRQELADFETPMRKKPPRNPIRHDTTVETQHFTIASASNTQPKTPKVVASPGSLEESPVRPRTSSMHSSLCTPERPSRRSVDRPGLKLSSPSKNIDLQLPQQTQAKLVLLTKDKRVEGTHRLAQQLTELLGQNERLLHETDTKVKTYLNDSLRSADCTSSLELVACMRKAFKSRVENIGQMFKLMEMVKGPNLPHDVAEVVFQTPRSLRESQLLDD